MNDWFLHRENIPPDQFNKNGIFQINGFVKCSNKILLSRELCNNLTLLINHYRKKARTANISCFIVKQIGKGM